MAVIVETREQVLLPVVLENVASVLNWTIHLIYGDANAEFVVKLAVVRRLQAEGRLRLLTVRNSMRSFDWAWAAWAGARGSYNCLLKSPAFWNCSAAEHILIFQSDSVLCNSSEQSIEDFLRYDYVGAVWPGGRVGNGGLSLRRRSTMLDLAIKYQRHGKFPANEDEFFSWGLRRHFRQRLAPAWVAEAFATDQVYAEAVGRSQETLRIKCRSSVFS